MTPEEKQIAIKQARALFQEQGVSGLCLLLRAITLLSKDEINLLRDWDAQLMAAIASATSLADLKAKCALLPEMPARTAVQAKTRILDKVAEQEAD